MSQPARYAYKSIEASMREALTEYLTELKEKPELLDDLKEEVYRNTILSKMMKNDENIAKMYEDKSWMKIVEPAPGFLIDEVDEYLENMLKEIMTYINEERADEFIEVFKLWEEKQENFKMAMVYAEELMTEDEYQSAMNEYKSKLKELADIRGLSTFQLKRQMPPFQNPLDAIDWIEDEMDNETIDDCLENPEEEGEEVL